MTLETCAAFYAGSKHPLSQYLSDGEEDGGGEKSENTASTDIQVMSEDFA